MINEKTLKFIREHAHDNPKALALKKPADAEIDFQTALIQIEGRQVAAKKLPEWAANDGIVFPPKVSLEQCSSEETACYKQTVIKRLLHDAGIPADRFVDMTGGFGIDFSYLSALFKEAVYIERQDRLCQLAKHNFSILGLTQAQVIQADCVEAITNMDNMSVCYADPARRDATGRKTVLITDCDPDLGKLQETLEKKTRFCMFKLSPLLDISHAASALHHVSEVHVVCLQDECKELLLITDNHKQDTNYTCHCINLGRSYPSYTFSPAEEQSAVCNYAKELGNYLYEPHAGILKAGAFKSIACRFGLKKLHPNSHLYTSDRLAETFPGRSFQIDACGNFSKASIKQLTDSLDKANLTVRNFPADVSELRKRLKLKDGGDVYLFATTLADNTHALIRTHKIQTGNR